MSHSGTSYPGWGSCSISGPTQMIYLCKKSKTILKIKLHTSCAHVEVDHSLTLLSFYFRVLFSYALLCMLVVITVNRTVFIATILMHFHQDLQQVMVSGPNLNETSIVSGGYGGPAGGIIPTSTIKGTASNPTIPYRFFCVMKVD